MALLVVLVVKGTIVNGQILAVNTLQNLSFGTLAQGSTGGTITISDAGMVTTTGSVVSLAFGGINDASAAVFEIEAPVGTVISISGGPDASLIGSNGGSMTLRLGNTNPLTPFAVVNQTGRTNINLGGTLTIGNQAVNPPGAYNGTFYVTINNE